MLSRTRLLCVTQRNNFGRLDGRSQKLLDENAKEVEDMTGLHIVKMLKEPVNVRKGVFIIRGLETSKGRTKRGNVLVKGFAMPMKACNAGVAYRRDNGERLVNVWLMCVRL